MIILECAALIVSHGDLCYLPTSPTEFISLAVAFWKGSDAETVRFFLTNSFTITVDHKKRCLTLFLFFSRCLHYVQNICKSG